MTLTSIFWSLSEHSSHLDTMSQRSTSPLPNTLGNKIILKCAMPSYSNAVIGKHAAWKSIPNPQWHLSGWLACMVERKKQIQDGVIWDQNKGQASCGVGSTCFQHKALYHRRHPSPLHKKLTHSLRESRMQRKSPCTKRIITHTVHSRGGGGKSIQCSVAILFGTILYQSAAPSSIA